MKIIHLVHYFPPLQHGGTQDYVANIADCQQGMGHDVMVISGSSDLGRGISFEPGLRESGVQVQWFFRDGATEAYSAYVGSERIETQIAERVEDFGADLVHLHHWQALSSGIISKLKTADIPVIVTLHDFYTTCMRFFRMPDPTRFCAPHVTFLDCAQCVSADLPGHSLAEIETVASSRVNALQNELAEADAVLCVSQAQKDFLVSLPTFLCSKVEVEGIGVPESLVVPPCESPRGETLKLVQWGGLDPRKGVHLISQAMAASQHANDMELHVFGDTPERAYLQEITSWGGNVVFHGSYETSEILGFASRFHLAVFPYIAFETYGLSVDEALHAGIPLVVSDRGAPCQRIGSRGRALPAENPQALADFLDEVYLDRGILDEMRRGVHLAKTLEAHVPALLARYREILETPK